MREFGDKIRENRGFTLIEVLVAMSILMMIVLMMSTLFQQSNMAWNNGMRQAEMSIQARAAMSLIRRDLSQAVAAEEYPCSFSSGGFSVYVLGTTTGDVRTIKKVRYSGTINRSSEDYNPSDGGGAYFGNAGNKKSGSLLDADKFVINVPSGWSSTNLPAWVDISITLSKDTAGTAGIKVWSNGRDKIMNTTDDVDKRLRTWKD